MIHILNFKFIKNYHEFIKKSFNNFFIFYNFYIILTNYKFFKTNKKLVYNLLKKFYYNV